jgi:hypothetical protein
MSDMTEARVREILDGLEGVTPGPWIYAPGRDGDRGAEVYQRINDSDVYEGYIAEADNRPVAAHIARLDPDTVRSLCTLALSAIASRQPVVEALREAVGKEIGDPLTGSRFNQFANLYPDIAAAIRALTKPEDSQ